MFALIPLSCPHSLWAAELPPLKIVDGQIVNPEGERVVLKGCNLGNWLILELWMFNLRNAGVHDEHGLESVLAERFGKAEAWRLMEVWRDNFITERDIRLIKSFGMNVLRLPFEYELLEDDSQPMELRPSAYEYFDRCVEWAEKYDMYVVLDLHGAAGRQNRYAHSGHADQNKFWFDESYQTRTLWLWGEIAKRYADTANVLGYEALNEPWHGGEQRLLDFMKRWYAKVRLPTEIRYRMSTLGHPARKKSRCFSGVVRQWSLPSTKTCDTG
jgi:glucan 1,3-beta-glucosidase